VLDVGAVDGEDDVAHFVDELEDGERGVGSRLFNADSHLD
jgi:hypothetical protein